MNSDEMHEVEEDEEEGGEDEEDEEEDEEEEGWPGVAAAQNILDEITFDRELPITHR